MRHTSSPGPAEGGSRDRVTVGGSSHPAPRGPDDNTPLVTGDSPRTSSLEAEMWCSYQLTDQSCDLLPIKWLVDIYMYIYIYIYIYELLDIFSSTLFDTGHKSLHLQQNIT